MGDVGRGFFVREGIPEYLRDHVVPQADIVTPNQFELEFLVGRTVATQADLVAAARELVARGPQRRARDERTDLRHPAGLDPDGVRHRRRTPGW